MIVCEYKWTHLSGSKFHCRLIMSSVFKLEQYLQLFTTDHYDNIKHDATARAQRPPRFNVLLRRSVRMSSRQWSADTCLSNCHKCQSHDLLADSSASNICGTPSAKFHWTKNHDIVINKNWYQWNLCFNKMPVNLHIIRTHYWRLLKWPFFLCSHTLLWFPQKYQWKKLIISKLM